MQQQARNAQLEELEQRLAAQPADTDLRQTLAMAYRSIGDLGRAEEHLREGLRHTGEDAVLLNDLGVILKGRERYSDALEIFRRALAVMPSMAECHYNAANVLVELQRPDEARAAYEQALALKADFPQALHKLANIYRKREEYQKAIPLYRRAIELKPDFVQPVFTLGLCYQSIGEHKKAARCFQASAKLAPHLPKPYVALANVFFELGEYRLSWQYSRKAIEVKPDFAPAWARLADVQAFQGEALEARESFEKALQLDPDHTHSRYTLTFIKAMLCDWSTRERDVATFRELAYEFIGGEDEENSISPLHLNYFPVEHAMHLRVAERHAARIEKHVVGVRERLHFTFDRPENERLRIGYLSPDFRTHAVNTILHQMYRHHDREHFEIFAYSTVKPEENNTYRNNVINGVDTFIDIHPLSHEESARRIYEDRIDILIDLGGYTTHSRPEIPALRPAPVQVQYLGYLDTMGAEFIDYILGDKICLPEEISEYYSERFVWLPHVLASSAMDMPAKTPQRKDYGLPEDAFVFCCLNAPYKIEPGVFDVWMNILREVPASVLWLQDFTAGGIIGQNLRAEAEKRGVSGARLIFAGKIPLAEHNARFALADLFLDTFVFTAGATAVGALTGVPILARSGSTYSERLSSAIVQAAGMPEMICDSTEAYYARAVELARNPHQLAAMRARLREEKAGALYNLPRFVRSLEEAYRRMWAIHKKRELPQLIDLSDFR